jgi:hypothetical protein
VTDEDLVRLIDHLEDVAPDYLTLADVARAAPEADLAAAIADDLLLVDYRTRLDGGAVTLCRLNRHHPLVARLTGW